MKGSKTLSLLVLLILALPLNWLCQAHAQEPADLPGTPRSLPASEFKPAELLVKFQAGTSGGLRDRAPGRYGASRIGSLYGLDVELWQVPAGRELDVVAQLNADPLVEYAEPNYLYYAVSTPNDPSFTKQWAHPKIQSPAAWDISTGSSSTTVAVVDTGIDETHPDLAAKIVAGYDFVDNDANPHDLNGHGTHVAGISAAVTNNGVGVAGMDWQARIMAVRVLDDQGSGYTSWIISGIQWAYQHGARVINLSLGGPSYSQAMQDVINSAHAAGSLVVAAMGNDGSSTPAYPAAYANVFAVASTTPQDTAAYYSNYGSHCDIAAPGGEMGYLHDPDGIYSTLPTYPVYMTIYEGYSQSYDYLQGTSQATPYVSGLAALVWSVDPGLTPDEVQTAIESAAVDLGAPGWDSHFGHGRINAVAALPPPPSRPFSVYLPLVVRGTALPPCAKPLTGVTVSGPTTGQTGTAYTFSAAIQPSDATAPVTYTWSPTPGSGQGTASATYTWTTVGSKTITVTAGNCGGQVSDSHTIAIGEAPASSTVIVDNGTGCDLCYEVYGTGIGEKCYSAGAYATYGTIPAGWHTFHAYCCCGSMTASEYYDPGTFIHEFWCSLGIQSQMTLIEER